MNEIIEALENMTDEQLAEVVQAVPRLCLRNCPKNESPYCSGDCAKELEEYKDLQGFLQALAVRRIVKQ